MCADDEDRDLERRDRKRKRLNRISQNRAYSRLNARLRWGELQGERTQMTMASSLETGIFPSLSLPS
eukprot:3557205-Pleurochrysis_carterae.AAC.1